MMPPLSALHSAPVLSQRGTSLFIALIALVALSIAGIALVRSVDTSNVIAGNIAFRQGTLHASDVGVETAFDALATIVTTSLDNTYPSGCSAGGCNYYPTEQNTVDSRGIPTVINWTNVPGTAVNTSYTVKYVIDRMCEGPAPVTDVSGKCSSFQPSDSGSKKSGAVKFTGSQLTYYRISVQVKGPRDTTSYVQALVLR
jgi:Tfp pilus assembly protein PilX